MTRYQVMEMLCRHTHAFTPSIIYLSFSLLYPFYPHSHFLFFFYFFLCVPPSIIALLKLMEVVENGKRKKILLCCLLCRKQFSRRVPQFTIYNTTNFISEFMKMTKNEKFHATKIPGNDKGLKLIFIFRFFSFSFEWLFWRVTAFAII